MVILLIIKRFDFGGSENHVCELANNLALKGHQVILLGRKGRQVRKLLPAVRYISFLLNDILLPFQVLALSVIVLMNRVDVIHGHQRLGILAASLTGFLTRTKVIATVHGRTRFDLKHALSRRLTGRFIFVSRKVLENASNIFNLDGNAVLISNGVEIAPLMRTPDPFTICHISRIDFEASSVGVPVMMVNSKRMGGMLTRECYDTVKEGRGTGRAGEGGFFDGKDHRKDPLSVQGFD